MRRTRPDSHDPGPYGHLLQRVALALEEADTAVRMRADPPAELELSDLTLAELALVRAYVEGDLPWLRGWHAAAEELAQHAADAARPAPATRLPPKTSGRRSPLVRQRKPLCCALCGAVADVKPVEGVRACLVCGSQLFRTGKTV